MLLRRFHSQRAFAVVAILAGLAVVPAGCATHAPSRVYDRPAVQSETFTVGTPQMVLGAQTPIARSPATNANGGTAGSAAGEPRGGRATPWWVDRNDGYLNVRQGSGLVRHEAFVNVQVDRQQSHGDDIHNTFRRRSITVERGGF